MSEVLSPKEASFIATNAYFTLQGWVNNAPVAGAASHLAVRNRVLGAGNLGTMYNTDKEREAGLVNPTLAKTELASAKLGRVHTAMTGSNRTGRFESGFGYTLTFQRGGRRQSVIAVRGTRQEMQGGSFLNRPDVITDACGTTVNFDDFGPIHQGFYDTYDSMMPAIERDPAIASEIIHVVGHSLGGAVATLIAGKLASQGKTVKLYTFGSPRVATRHGHQSFERAIGDSSIYRVAHTLDIVSVVGPFPYIHLHPADNHVTIPSPNRALWLGNHEMQAYIKSVQDANDWGALRRMGSRVNMEESVFAHMMIQGDNPNWLQQGCARTLTILFRLFKQALQMVSTTAHLAVTGLDLLSEAIFAGANFIEGLGKVILKLLRWAGDWAGVAIQPGREGSMAIIRQVLAKMLAAIKPVVARSLQTVSQGLSPIPVRTLGFDVQHIGGF